MKLSAAVQDAVAERRRWCSQTRREGMEGVYLAQAKALPLPPSFNDALRVPRGSRAVVTEVVRRAPWGAGTGTESEIDFGGLAAALHDNGSSALAIRPDEVRFGGGYADILAAAQSTPMPVLCRDLIVDHLQITVARAHGASAVVLCAALLDADTLRSFFQHATELGLDVVAEVRSVQEAEMCQRIRIGHVDSAGVRIFCVSSVCPLGVDVDVDIPARVAAALPDDALWIVDAIGSPESLEALGYEAVVRRPEDVSTDEIARSIGAISGISAFTAPK